MTLGIAHREGARAVLDLVREVEPPFSPGQVIVDTFAPILQQYGLRTISGDRHAIGFVGEYLDACSVKFVPATLSKSDYYVELLAVANTGAVELLDHPTLRSQLLALERRSVRGGKDSVDHPRGGHDDVANVCAGVVVSVTGVGQPKKPRLIFGTDGFMSGAEGKADVQEQLRVLARATIAQREAQDEADWQREREAENRPMLGEPVWWTHKSLGEQ